MFKQAMKNDFPYPVDAYKHWIDDAVRFSDLDPLGHVNNNAVGQYFENARAALFQELTPNWPHRDDVFVLAKTTINFHQELHLPARLRIGTGVIRVGRTSLTISNILMSEDRLIASGESVSVLILDASRRPVAISDDIRACAQGLLLPTDD